MTSKTFPIRGAYHHPPANEILPRLSVGTPLYILAEPQNPYDVNAIQVWLPLDALKDDDSDMDSVLAGSGTSIAELKAEQTALMVGYIGKEFAAELRQDLDFALDPVPATYSVGANGKSHLVRFNAP